MKFLLCLLTLVSAFFPVSAQVFSVDIDPYDPPEGIFSEEWSEMYINGDKVGYTHTILKRRGDEIITMEDSFMNMGRGPTSITTISTTHTKESVDGTPISILDVTREGDRTKTQNIQFSPEGATIEVNDGARAWTREITLDPGFVLSWSFLLELVKQDLRPGEEFEAHIYVPDIVLDQTLPITTKYIGEEEISIRGETHQAIKIEQTLRLVFLPLKLSVWINHEGKLLLMEMPIGGMDITLIGSTEEQAKASFSPPDFFTATLIPLNRSIPENASTVTFTLHPHGESMPDIPDTAYQSVVKNDDGTASVTVRRGELRFTEPSAVDPAYLEATPLVDFEDPAILNLVTQADLENLSQAEKVRKLVEIADNAIAIKSMDLGFATASETVKLSEGDCTEHALLLTALGRAAGIPTRGASGVVYFPLAPDQPVMGYHMWAQIWNGSEWLDVDAAFGSAETAPIRILYSTTDLSDPTLSEDVLTIAQFLGQTTIEVVDVTTPEN